MANYNRKDSYYKKAKEAGYRSRAYYKLQNIQNKHAVIRKGATVLDMGAWPGGWMQLALKLVGKGGQVVGIDLAEIETFNADNAYCIQGDLRDDSVQQEAQRLAGGRFDVVISDMSPKLTGIKDADRLASVGLLELALWCSQELLKPGGNFVAKAFKCNETEEFYRTARPQFAKLHRMEVAATRKTSNEIYLVGLSFSPRPEMVASE